MINVTEAQKGSHGMTCFEKHKKCADVYIDPDLCKTM